MYLALIFLFVFHAEHLHLTGTGHALNLLKTHFFHLVHWFFIMCSIYEACASFRLAKFHYVFYCSFIVAPNALLSTSNYASCVYWNCIHGNVCLFEQKDRAALLEVRTW